MSATSVFNSTQDVQFGSGHAFQDETIAVQSQNTLPFLQVDLQASDSADITSDGNLVHRGIDRSCFALCLPHGGGHSGAQRTC